MSLSAARRLAVTAAALTLSTGVLAGCQATSGSESSGADSQGQSSNDTRAEEPTPVTVVPMVGAKPRQVPLDQQVKVRAEQGSLVSVKVTSPKGELRGAMKGDVWQAQGRLEPGTVYRVQATAERQDGARQQQTRTFRTQDLTLDEQTYASVAPLPGETVGVGMPVIVSFDVPVADKANFERHMKVRSTPAQPGSWHWISDNEAHWRPKNYWQAGTDVHVDVDVNSLSAGNGVWGQESRSLDFHVGDANVYRVNAATHEMQVTQNGRTLRSIPITTGKPGFTTRSGTKVIIEKFESKTMRSETIGISDQSSSDYYDLDDVKYAMRLTYSGEFMHAAPWSVGSQGYANVSHGCTGMSTDNAAWLYSISKRGDVVEYTGTDRPMTMTNGYGDWNVSFDQYRSGSAL